jgi:CheY-like chemotaxis protein
MTRVLVIDDDVLFVKLMVHALRERGHEVDFALEGLDGFQKFNDHHYDAVVCDIIMPEQEGVETITRMRRVRQDLGIVAISGGMSRVGGAGLDVLDIAGKLGADKTLTKPFMLSELTEAVDAAILDRCPAGIRMASA